MEKDIKYMNAALKEAYKAYKKNEIPVGAVVVFKDKIIARAFNKKEMNRCALEHAELIAIRRACHKIKNWRLNDATIYVTLEPCPMCASAIKQSRIKKIVYLIDNKNFENKKNTEQILKTIDSNQLVEKVKLDKEIMGIDSLELINKIFLKKR